jgi:flagellar hook protein FlgE
MGLFSIPLSGLGAAEDSLRTVSNNLSNLNTDGYKDQYLQFSDVFAQAGAVNGAGDPMQTGLGVQQAATVSNFSDGNLNSTGIASNMALSGQGFFVVKNANGIESFTRAGDFSTNSAGYLTTPQGDLLMGYPSVNGVVNTSAALQPINVGEGFSTPAVATGAVSVTANLNSDTAVGGAGPISTLAMYDSLGGQHQLSINYTKTGANTWSYSVTIPTADVTAGGTGTTVVGSGTLNFDGNGNLVSTSGVTPISIPSFSDGATGPQAIGGPFGTAASPTITQTASANSTSATTQDGYASGTLQSYSVQGDGTVSGTFSNGKTLALGQVAVASFANNQGLSAMAGNKYQMTVASGYPVIGVAGTGGRATITGGAVEQSNVDIAKEFSSLIVAQQAYSANAKSITTFNQVSQATLQMLQ